MPSSNDVTHEPSNDCRDQGHLTSKRSDKADKAGLRIRPFELHRVSMRNELAAIYPRWTFALGVVCLVRTISTPFIFGINV